MKAVVLCNFISLFLLSQNTTSYDVFIDIFSEIVFYQIIFKMQAKVF